MTKEAAAFVSKLSRVKLKRCQLVVTENTYTQYSELQKKKDGISAFQTRFKKLNSYNKNNKNISSII